MVAQHRAENERYETKVCLAFKSVHRFLLLLFTWHLRMQNEAERRQKWTAANIRMKIRRNLFKMRRSFFIHRCYKWRSGFADLICWCRCMMQLRQTLCIACFKCGKECARRSINCSFSKKKRVNLLHVFILNVKKNKHAKHGQRRRRRRWWLKNSVRRTWRIRKECINIILSLVDIAHSNERKRNSSRRENDDACVFAIAKCERERVCGRCKRCWIQMKINNWTHGNLSPRKQINQN